MANRKWMEALEAMAAKAGLQVEAQTNHVFGEYKGYTVCILPTGQNNVMTMMFSVSQNDTMPSAAVIKQFVKQCKAVEGSSVQRYKVSYTIRAGMTVGKNMEKLETALEEAVAFFRDMGFVNCCEHCGKTGKTEAYLVSGKASLLCEECFAGISSEADAKAQAENEKGENLIGGIVGALLGALLGALVIVLVGQLGYVSAWSGVIMGVCTAKGYEWLGRRLSVKGILISALVIIGMVFFAHQADWAISIYRQITPKVDVFTIFTAIPELIREGSIEAHNYYAGLGLLYLFSLLGAIPTVIGVIQNNKQKHVTAKMFGKKDAGLGR